MRRFLYPAAFVLVVLVAAAYLFVSGARLGAPFFFLVAGAGVLAITVHSLYRTAMALVRDAPAEERRVATGRRRKELEREKQSVLKAIKELDFDHEMHKISDGDHAEIAATYRARAVRILRQLDEAGLEYRVLLERDLQTRKGLRAPATAVAAPSLVAARPVAEKAEVTAAPVAAEPAIVAAPVAAAGPSAHACPSCGTNNDDDAAFCKRCGGKIAASVAS